MKQESNRIARVAVPLMAATLLSTPLMAQDAAAPVQVTPPAAAPVQAAPAAAAPVQVTPPPVVPTVTPPAAQAAAPTPRSASGTQSATPVNPEAAAAAEAEAQERAAASRSAASRPARATTPTRAAPAAARTTASATPAPTVAPVANTPAVTAPTPAAPAAQTTAPAAPVAQEQAAPAAAITQTSQQTQTTGGTPLWPIVVGALVVLAGLAAFLFLRRRRRAEDEQAYWEEPVYVEAEAERPMTIEPVVAPVAAAAASPAALDLADHDAIAAVTPPDEAQISDAPAEDVAALTAGETVTGRPWLELAMRPLRAGTSADEAVVEIELTVGNAGEIAAEDVRISTFMLTAESSDVEQMLVDPPANAAVQPVTIDAGEGTRVDATLALPRSAVNGHFQPIVVADARYRLPDGSEGRTSASFLVGIDADGDADLAPLDTAHAEMREDVTARLYREPQRA